jgi:hypothetical protein
MTAPPKWLQLPWDQWVTWVREGTRPATPPLQAAPPPDQEQPGPGPRSRGDGSDPSPGHGEGDPEAGIQG